MSFSESSTLSMQHKHTLSECEIENCDPLVVKKKACEAAKITKKKTQVFIKIYIHIYITHLL